MKKCSIGGQAVMEGVMMKSDAGIALCVRRADGSIDKDFTPCSSKAKKGTFLGLPIIRGVVAFVESLTIGMKTLTKSAEMLGDDIDEKPSKFELYLSKKLGKSADKILIGTAGVLAVILALGLFFVLPTLISSWIFGANPGSGTLSKSLTEGFVRLLIFLLYIVSMTLVKDIRRVFMYHGAEHKVIACYEADDELTPENAAKHTRLHPRCGTNYLFLVMAISIAFFAVVGFNDNFFLRLATRLIFLPLVAGISYEVLKLAAKSDGIIARIVRAPGLGLQLITTKEPTLDMLEVAICAFNMAMEKNGEQHVVADNGEAKNESMEENKVKSEDGQDTIANG